MKPRRHWKVTIKEKNNPNLLTPEMIGNYDENDVIAFLGLQNEDVEWYRLEDITQ